MNRLFSKISNAIILLLCAVYSFIRGRANKILTNPKKILILRWKPHIGDVVYITPMFRAIKEKYPNAKLYVMGAGRVKDVIDYNPNIDEYIPYENNFFTIIGKLKKEEIDFACLANAGSTMGLGLLYLANIKGISNFSTVNGLAIPSISYSFLSKLALGKPFYTGRYVPPQYLKLLKPLGIETNNCHFQLYFSKKAEKTIGKIFNDNDINPEKDFIVVIAPGGAIRERWWPSKQFAQIADYLYEKHNAHIFLLGAGKDTEPIKEILGYLNKNTKVINLLNQNLDEFKAFISKSHLIIGNDSGPMVTADAFDIPNIVLVGPTDEREYHKPPGLLNKVIVAKDRKMNSIDFDSVRVETETIINNLNKIKNE